MCVYVLLGIAFAGIYAADQRRRGHATSSRSPGRKTNVDFLYFSFITMTTVGYGDLTPGTDVGRVIVTFEALIGQVFLVTLVARLCRVRHVARHPRRATARRQPSSEIDGPSTQRSSSQLRELHRR